MDREEVIKWLKIMKANLNSFPEVSNAKKIEALAEAIRLLKNEQSKEPSGSEKSNRSEIPTSSATKNDLGVREFEEIVVEYPPEDLCTYPEYKGKPYLSIKYKEGNDCYVGYGTYNPKVFSRYLRDYFMPSVAPIRPKGHWIKVELPSRDAHECSECGNLAIFDECRNEEKLTDFCPYCGSDNREMVEE